MEKTEKKNKNQFGKHLEACKIGIAPTSCARCVEQNAIKKRGELNGLSTGRRECAPIDKNSTVRRITWLICNRAQMNPGINSKITKKHFLNKICFFTCKMLLFLMSVQKLVKFSIRGARERKRQSNVQTPQNLHGNHAFEHLR